MWVMSGGGGGGSAAAVWLHLSLHGRVRSQSASVLRAATIAIIIQRKSSGFVPITRFKCSSKQCRKKLKFNAVCVNVTVVFRECYTGKHSARSIERRTKFRERDTRTQ